VLSQSPSRQHQPHRRSPPSNDALLQEKEKEKEKHAKTGHTGHPVFGYHVRGGKGCAAVGDEAETGFAIGVVAPEWPSSIVVKVSICRESSKQPLEQKTYGFMYKHDDDNIKGRTIYSI